MPYINATHIDLLLSVLDRGCYSRDDETICRIVVGLNTPISE